VSRTKIVAVAAFGALLAGCGSSSSSSSSSTATSTPAAAARPATPIPYLGTRSRITGVGSTVPANGDVNPYGIVVVPASVGAERAGEVLISNFNAKSNNQGTGTTIVQLGPSGSRSVFAKLSARSLPGACPGGVGLTTALGLLPGGDVVVGSLPTTNGLSAAAKAGCLIVVDPQGKAVSTIAGPNIQGPWDMATVDQGNRATLFVSNALNGGAVKGEHTIDNSTVVRITLSTPAGARPTVLSEQVIANRIPWRDDKAALVIGPTGVALAANGTLYVADTLRNAIIAIPQAMTRTTALADSGITLAEGGHLIQPLGLTLAPNGDILTSNAGDGNFVETTPAGKQVAVRAGDAKAGAGSLFGLALAPSGGLYYVDDALSTLRLLH
jgi:hypothetical protein